MSRQIQLRRGTAAQHETFTGADGEVTVDTTNKTLRVHDGATPGGVALARQSTLDAADYVVAFQVPTANNNYTWYRKYKSGWVEQGGYETYLNTDQRTITLPIPMSDIHYIITLGAHYDSVSPMGIGYIRREPTNESFIVKTNNEDSNMLVRLYWHVSGVAQ